MQDFLEMMKARNAFIIEKYGRIPTDNGEYIKACEEFNIAQATERRKRTAEDMENKSQEDMAALADSIISASRK